MTRFRSEKASEDVVQGVGGEWAEMGLVNKDRLIRSSGQACTGAPRASGARHFGPGRTAGTSCWCASAAAKD